MFGKGWQKLSKAGACCDFRQLSCILTGGFLSISISSGKPTWLDGKPALDSIRFVCLPVYPNGSGTSPRCDTRRAVAESGWAWGAHQSEEQVETYGKPHIFPATPPQKKGCPVTRFGKCMFVKLSELNPISKISTRAPYQSHTLSNQAHMQHRKMLPGGAELEEGHPAHRCPCIFLEFGHVIDI